MTDHNQDMALEQLFSKAPQELYDDNFTTQVMDKTDQLRRSKLIKRILLGLILGLLAIPLKDAAIPLTQLALTSLFDINHALLGSLLAPINTVGGILSISLLLLRAGHKRLFSFRKG